MRTLCAIPCFNEEVAIGSVIVQAKPHVDEVLVIDDGSEDRTAEVARLAGASVIVHEKNSGKGTAVQNAFQYAKKHGFDAVVLMDGDGQHDPKEIPLLLEPIRQGKDIGLGFRFGDKTEMPKWRRAGKRVLDYATAAGGAGVVTDSQCGFRAFGKKAIDAMAKELGSKGFGVESEQLVVANDYQLTMQNVTIHCRYDGVDGSTKGPVTHALEILQSMFVLAVRRRPLQIIAVPGLACLLFTGALVLLGVVDGQARLLALVGALIGTLALIVGIILFLATRKSKCA